MLINVFVCQFFPWCRWTLSINFLFCEIELLGARSPCPDTDSGTTWAVLCSTHCSRCCIQDTECSKVQTLVTLGIGPDGRDGALALMIYFNPWSTLTEVYWRMKAIDTEKLRRNRRLSLDGKGWMETFRNVPFRFWALYLLSRQLWWILS